MCVVDILMNGFAFLQKHLIAIAVYHWTNVIVMVVPDSHLKEFQKKRLIPEKGDKLAP
jgi:hypothetical protein